MWQLAGTFIGLALLVVLVMYFFSWRTNLALIEEATNELQIKSGIQISDKLTLFLDSAVENNQHNVLFAREKNYSALPKHWQTIFIDEILHSRDITNVAVANTAGEYFGIDRLNSGQLIHQTARHGASQDLIATIVNDSGEQGAVISRTSNYDPRTRPWFTSAATSRSQTWSDVYKHYSDDALQIAVSYPLFDNSNTLKAVLVSAVRLNHLSKYLKSIKVSNDSQIIIVDAKGLLVASTSDAPLYNIVNGATNRIEPRNSGDPLIRVMSGAVGEKPGEVVHVSHAGKKFTVNVAGFNHSYGLSWKIISAVPSEIYLGSLKQKQGNLYLSIGLLLLLSLGCSFWMGRRVVTPLVYLNKAVNDFRKGQLLSFKPLDRNDELGQLTASFVVMAEENTSLHEELRAKIHDLEEACKAHERSELKFRTIFNNTTDAVFVRSFAENGEAGPFIEVNEVACTRLGYSREELLRLSTEDINYSPTCQCLENIRKIILEQGKAVFETAHRTKDGRAIPVEISSHLFRLDGRPVILSVARDISERKKTEQDLTASNEKYRQLLQQQLTVFDSSPVGIISRP